MPMAKFSFFCKSKSKTRSEGHMVKCWHKQKSLNIMNTHEQHESPHSFSLKVIAKVRFFTLEAQGPCTGHRSIIAILHCVSLHEKYTN